MGSYKHILLAVDFFDQNQSVADKAKDLAEKYQARLSIVHVVDTLPIADPAYEMLMPFDMDLTAEFMATAKTKLIALAKELNVDEADLRLEAGSPKQEIIRVAEEIQADLIVLGSHGRHGLALLLGSTANGVLHYAGCDVLAVRIQ
ncbi:universal stress protein [Methylosarcina fibrata]|uniref:universal stress protein n=1 Tax=Methylosarcina fibrata TaxID=105972 RepID=UPI000382E226|nr:universal stress protein [Methylosarcina fibrata]